MKHRASGKAVWWTYVQCQMRWSRFPATDYLGEGEPLGTERCVFGKYVGYTFKEIFQKDNLYCDWVLKTYESGDKQSQYIPFTRLAKYTAKYESQMAVRDTIQEETGFCAIGETDDDLDV